MANRENKLRPDTLRGAALLTLCPRKLGTLQVWSSREQSVKVKWDDILDFAPHYIFVMPCGFNIDKTINEIDSVTSNSIWHQTPASQKGNVYLVDANSYFSRPGPRIVDGIEIIARTIHPDLFKMEPPPGSILNLRNYMQIQAVLG